MREKNGRQHLPQRPGQVGKMLVPLLGVLVALAVGVAAVATMFGLQERDKRVAKERELHLAAAENADLKTRLERLQQEKVRVDEDLAAVRQELAESKEELVQAVTARETLAKSVEDREQEIGRITKDLEQVRTQTKQLEEQLAQIQRERDDAKQQLSALEQAKSELEAKLAEASAAPTVELDKVVVGDQSSIGAGSAASSGSTGQVVVVNREYDFIVMNLGKNQGLSIGQEFQVVRDNQVLGRVKVEKVYDELSAAAILPNSNKESIQEGDLVNAL